MATKLRNNPNGGSGSLRLTPTGALDPTGERSLGFSHSHFNGFGTNCRLDCPFKVNTPVTNPTGNFMSITGASTGREFRFGLRVAF